MRTAAALLILTLFCAGFAHTEEFPAKLPEIKLSDQNGKEWDVHTLKEAKAVVLYIHGVGCPIVRQSVPSIEEIKTTFANKGVEFFMLNANPYDLAEDLKLDAKDFSITMPILMDKEQEVAKALRIERTATVIVAVPDQEWKIVYRGAMNDRYDYLAQRPQAKEEWLKDALNSVLEGKEVAKPLTQAKGCLINYLDEK